MSEVRLPRLLNTDLSEAGRLHPEAQNVTLNLIPLHRVTMTLAEDDLPVRMHDFAEVYTQNGSVGIYRATRITHTLRGKRQIELSHGLDVLSDSTFAVIEKYEGTVPAFLARIMAAQTQTVNGTPFWQLGTVEDTNVWNKDIQYDNLMECLTEIARTEEDFWFTFDFTTWPWTLNFVRRNDSVLSEFRLSRNVGSCEIAYDDSTLCTRLHLSVTTENQTTVRDKDGVDHTFTKTSEGYYTYNDTAARDDYGVVVKTAGVDRKDVPTTADLQAWVDAYFARHNAPTLQITINGAELNRLTGVLIDEMHIGRICRVAVPEYGGTFNERIVSINYPDALRTPARVTVSLANKRETAEGAFAEIRKNASSGAGGARKNKQQNDNTDADAEIQKIKYELKADEDDKKFSVLATESEWDDLMQSYTTTHKSYYEQTARGFLSAVYGNGLPDGATVWNWSPDDQYVVGDYVRYNGAVYKCITAHTGNWDASCFELVSTLSSRITQTETEYASLYEKTGVADLGSGQTLYSFSSAIKQTADSIRQEVTAARGGQTNLTSALDLKANKATLISEINNASGGTISAGKLEVQPGSVLIQAINGGSGTVTIDADKVNVTGILTASGLITETGYAGTIRATTVGGVTVEGTTVKASTLQLAAGSSYQTVSRNAYKIDGVTQNDTILMVGNSVLDIPATYIKTITKNSAGDTLTITDSEGNVTTFNRATTLGGVWSGGMLTVTASPQNEHYYDYLGQGETSWSGATATVQVTHSTSQHGAYSNVYSVQVNAAGKLTTANVTPGSSAQTITAGRGDYADYIGFSSVTVAAGASHTAADVTLSNTTAGTPVLNAQDQQWYASGDVVKMLDGDTDTETITINVQSAINVGYTYGWRGCAADVALSPSSNQTINPGGSVTVYLKGKTTSGGTTENLASVKVTANTGMSNSMALSLVSGISTSTSARTFSDGNSSFVLPAGRSLYLSPSRNSMSSKTVYWN